MTAGDRLNHLESVVDGAYMTIQPAANEEFLIDTISHNDDCEITQYNGTLEALVDSDTGPGSWSGHRWSARNSSYLRVKNTSGATQTMGYMGVQTK